MDDPRQLRLPLGSPPEGGGVKPRGPEAGPRPFAAPPPDEPCAGGEDLLEQVLSRENLIQALSRVKANRGSPGIDGMTVKQLPEYLMEKWPVIREALLQGSYRPSPVRRVEIPKPGDQGVRLLGIPTVLDRFIQQALAQVLGQLFDPLFSDASYGFRPGRSAHQAVKAAEGHIRSGHGWVVDVDLAKFFDRVNHDLLMARVARQVKDKRVLKLIRHYLESGVMLAGVVVRTAEGTPQGGPLSPLLANILLDDLDRELERREHLFVRYADDCNIYVRSRRAGERVMESVPRYLEDRLKLKVNVSKSAVDRPGKRKFLGFRFHIREGQPHIGLSPEALKRVKDTLRRLTWRWKGRSLEETLDRLNAYVRGWGNYFAIAESSRPFEELDGWIRRRLRAILWHQWKRPRTRARNLRALGAPPKQARQWANTRKGAWRMSCSIPVAMTLNNAYWRDRGLVSLAEIHRLRHS